jgi:hypothetical protein
MEKTFSIDSDITIFTIKNLMKNLFLLMVVILFYSCKNQTQQSSAVQKPIEIIEPTVQLLSEAKTVSEDSYPETTISIQIDSVRINIADMINGEFIPKEKYAQYYIPDSALSAAGGWWAGFGDYFFVAKEGYTYAVYQGVMDEEQEPDDYNYKKVLTVDRTGKPIYSLNELLGFYTWESHDESVILFLGMNDDEPKIEFFEVDGMLPPIGELTNHLPSFRKTIFERFNLDMDDLTFGSDFGKGYFIKKGRQIEILFESKTNTSGAPLKLSRIE